MYRKYGTPRAQDAQERRGTGSAGSQEVGAIWISTRRIWYHGRLQGTGLALKVPGSNDVGV